MRVNHDKANKNTNGEGMDRNQEKVELIEHNKTKKTRQAGETWNKTKGGETRYQNANTGTEIQEIRTKGGSQ